MKENIKTTNAKHMEKMRTFRPKFYRIQQNLIREKFILTHSFIKSTCRHCEMRLPTKIHKKYYKNKQGSRKEELIKV
jgi:hypothetical protein